MLRFTIYYVKYSVALTKRKGRTLKFGVWKLTSFLRFPKEFFEIMLLFKGFLILIVKKSKMFILVRFQIFKMLNKCKLNKYISSYIFNS